jgi:hypothetical protein
MSKLFCKIGDLAVTIDAELPINIGNVVKIVGVSGYEKWSSYKTKIFLWKVEVASSDRPLVYEYPGGSIEKLLVGRIPDRYLRPIRPDELEQIQEQLQDLPIDSQSIENVKEVEYV